MQSLFDKLGLGNDAANAALWIGIGCVLLIIVIGLAVFLIRLLRPSLNMSGGQARGGRPQRLAVTDAFNLDRDGRRLVIIRRDNTEHLLLIGGPNDVLVEQNIVRGERLARGRNEGGESEAPALPEQLRPQVAPAATSPVVAPPPPPPAVNLPPFPSRSGAGTKSSPPLDDDFERALAAMQEAQRQHGAPPAKTDRPVSAPVAPPAPQPLPQPAPQFSPRSEAPAAPPRVPQPPAAPSRSLAPEPRAVPTPPRAEVPASPAPPAPPLLRDGQGEPVSEMARRLSEVLQRPVSSGVRQPFRSGPLPAPAAPKPEPASSAPTPGVSPAPPPPAADELPAIMESLKTAPAKPAAVNDEMEMDLLEEEMARLLGRPQSAPKSDRP